MNNKPKIRKKKRKIIGIILITTLILSVFIYYIEPRTWGDDGKLTISIHADKKSMNINDTVNITTIFHNIGTPR